ncbi:MAG: hypothetical protein NW224_24735, partial [Leptolyngbyaceae cyanobacterium bins.302]|nr:hypothetical protein [Leptolyngbyaceae cyanobacterium bins.302]
MRGEGGEAGITDGRGVEIESTTIVPIPENALLAGMIHQAPTSTKKASNLRSRSLRVACLEDRTLMITRLLS